MTRLFVITGSGVPQLTAVMDCAKVGRENGIPIISDGGTRTSGDVTKALAAGASSVMVGSLLGGTDESPGSVLTKNGKRFKVYRGIHFLFQLWHNPLLLLVVEHQSQ